MDIQHLGYTGLVSRGHGKVQRFILRYLAENPTPLGGQMADTLVDAWQCEAAGCDGTCETYDDDAPPSKAERESVYRAIRELADKNEVLVIREGRYNRVILRRAS